jgi:hypothetical protein
MEPASNAARTNHAVTEAECVARELASRDFNCPRCRYQLRGIGGNGCPECGLEITRSHLRFRVARWHCPAFFLGAAGILVAIPTPFVVMLSVTGASTDNNSWDNSARFDVIVAALWMTILFGVGMSWISWAGTVAKWPRRRHWLVVAACWLLPLISTALAWTIGVV